MSWNIQDPTGDKTNKFEISEFLSILTDNSIICLQETKSQIKIEGFLSFNSNRKNSRSGGVCFLIKNCLRKGVSRIACDESDDILAIKLDKYFFRLEFDLYLICFYISPSTSSIVKKDPDYTNKTFDALNNLSHKLKQKGEIILCGDANSRTSCLPDYISSYNSSSNFDIYDDIGYNIDLAEPRNNCDKVTVAPHCQLFLDFVINNELKILNGRTLGDSLGRTTCHKWNGSSTVDYFLASSWVRDSINTLRVLSLNSYSDHCPLVLNMTTHKHFTSNFQLPDLFAMPARFKWDSNTSPNEFRSALNSPEIKSKLNDIMSNDFPHNAESNNQITQALTSCLQTAAELSVKQAKKPKKLPHKRWFDRDCILSKRNLNRLACRISRNINNNLLRKTYFTERNKHSRLIKTKRLAYLDKLNQSIEEGHVLDWKKFKQLKQQNDASPLLDNHDLMSFYEFFTKLYKKPAPNTSEEPPPSDQNIHSNSRETKILNNPITKRELEKTIKSLKKGKSSSLDLISNEMLQSLNDVGVNALLKTFNHCLITGKYPWHTSVITPIYKSGNPFSPDNYRCICVGSCIGKLFSSILLDRLLLFRELYCPDPKEQLGFKKGAQTNDHVLTLKTTIDKYIKKQRVRLYTCFVDLKKAFDTVSRDILLHKITSLNISGEFFNVLVDMYNKSTARIKISNFLSPDIKMEQGTEQGHPLSPDLFKIFIRELSSLLISTGKYPHLNGISLSHLLWADDLVLLALDPRSLQKNIDILNNFCKKMGLEVNIKKTKVLTFCPSKQKPLYEVFKLGDNVIEHTSKYCYLGIIFDKSGSFTPANAELRAKALRALYSLKSNIIKTSLSYKSITTLFDTLVKPVLLYGCQIIAPHNKTMKYLSKTCEKTPENFLRYLAQDHYENFHLKFLKWNLSVHSKASNIGCWGDSGRYPLFYEATKLSIDYFEHVQDCFEQSDGSLLAAAFSVQKDLGLDWYTNISNVITTGSQSDKNIKNFLPPKKIRLSSSIADCMRQKFIKYWELAKNASPKLEFYNEIKTKFETEQYLYNIKNSSHRASVTRFRISAHNLYIERGRYKTPIVPRESRWCIYCHMKTGQYHIEDELHTLLYCPLYLAIKSRAPFTDLKDISNISDLFMDSEKKSRKFMLVGELIHRILELNQHFTTYYCSQDFHNNTGGCVII